MYKIPSMLGTLMVKKYVLKIERLLTLTFCKWTIQYIN